MSVDQNFCPNDQQLRTYVNLNGTRYRLNGTAGTLPERLYRSVSRRCQTKIVEFAYIEGPWFGKVYVNDKQIGGFTSSVPY